MKKIHWTLETLSCKVVWFLSTVIFVLLTGTGLIFTRYFAAEYNGESPYVKIACFPLTLLAALLIGGIIYAIADRVSEDGQRGKKQVQFILACVLLWCMAFGTAWVLLAVSTPVSDQAMVTSSAERFLEGDYGRLGYSKYLYYYPFQISLAAFEELVFYLFGVNNYTAFQLLNVLEITGTVYAGYRITALLFDRRKVEVSYLLLAAVCFPFLIFSAYVYSDVVAIFMSVVLIWQTLSLLKTGKKRYILGMILAASLAVLLRSNSLIILIAVCCVLVVKAISEKKWIYLLCILLMGAGILGSRETLYRYYEEKSGMELNDGMPSVLWIAMGMQEGDKEAGWYNGYSMYTYQDVCLYHGPTAKALGIAEIKARAKGFLKDPLYAVDFYFRKFTSQWNDPTYGCFIMTHATDLERNALGISMYDGNIKKLLEHFMDPYQLLIYGSILFLLLYRRKEKRSVEWYILLIGVLGGVLFHELWEAKSRYVLPYFIIMIPMAAAGLSELGDAVGRWRTKDEAVKAG